MKSNVCRFILKMSTVKGKQPSLISNRDPFAMIESDPTVILFIQKYFKRGLANVQQ